MADSLLDFDYNNLINKALGTTNQPFSGLINDPNYNSSLNVDTLLGAGLGYANSLYKDKTVGEKVLSTVTGAKAARQKGIDDYVQNILTQQDYSKNVLNMTKTQGELRQQPLDLLIKGFKAKEAPMDYELKQYQLEEAPYNLLLKQNEANLSTSNINGLRNLSLTLPPIEQQKLVTMGAKAYYDMNKLSNEEKIFYQSIGVSDIFNIPDDKVDIISQFNNTVPQADADAHNAKEAAAYKNDPFNYVPSYIDGKLDFVEKQQNNNTSSNTRNPQKSYGWSTNSEGQETYRGLGGEVMTRDEFNNLGRREKLLYNEANNREDYKKTYQKLENDKIADMKIISYGMGETRDVARNIEKILDNPRALKKLFTADGRLRVKLNEMTDSFFAELGGDAQDVKNLIETLKAKQFTVGIQKMRTNNPTGGAVGNVSDKEVAMFQSMEEFLGISGSGKNMYVALKDLYNKTKETQLEFEDLYRDDYGQSNYDKSNLPSMLHQYRTFGSDGDYATTLELALERANLANPLNGNLNPKTDKDLKSELQRATEYLNQGTLD
tara:strand:- start:1971 stop:3617 length:1647 start_codon:yes stop_codon:yes gene_type:complete